MRKCLKRFLLILLVICFNFTSLDVFADNMLNQAEVLEIHMDEGGTVLVKVLADDKDMRKVSTKDENYEYIVTYNKQAETMDIVINNLLNRAGSSYVHVDLNNISQSYKILENGYTEGVFDSNGDMLIIIILKLLTEGHN